ncbi:MAG: acyltransferase [Peptococcaceae bacterium]|nr:acyltransferase [Peptococcaceae bacterium]
MKKNSSFINNNFLNIVPLICSLMVIMIHQHTVSGTAFTLPSRIISFFTHGICTAAVPTFFLLSGYLFFRSANTFSDVFQKQKKRIKSVLMPFLAWSAFYYGMYAVVSLVVPGFLQGNVDLSVTGILKGIVFYQYSFPLWYMFQLCVFVLLTPAILLLLRSKVASTVVLAAAAVLGLLEWEPAVDVGGYERSLFQVNFFGYYLLGCMLTRLPNLQEAPVKLAKKLPWAVLLVLCAGAALLESLLFDKLIPCFNNRLAVPLVFAAFVLLMVKLCQREKAYAAPKFSTMIIYGVHSAVGVFLGKFIFVGLTLPTLLHFVVSLLAVTIVSVAVAWILRYIKPLHWVFSGDR